MTKTLNEKSIVKWIITILSVAMCAFHLYTSATLPLNAMEQRSLHFAFALALIFLWASLDEKKAWIRYLDYVLAVVGAIVNMYMFFNWLELSMRSTALILMDYIMGITAIVMVLIAAWRKVSIWLPIIAIAFIAYAYIGPHIQGYFWFPPISFERFIAYLYTSVDGIFGSCLEVSASTCFMYCLFAEFLLRLGAGQFLIDVSYSIFGRIRGGSSKVSVVACALFGMVSGSATSNVAATGSLTIPMMKESGYSAEDAGGICSSAAVGSMLMPPVMGAAAFVLAQMVNTGYGMVCIAAAVPAFLYYLALFLMVDLRAAKYGMKGLPKESIPVMKKVLKEGWHYIISLAVLILLLVILQWSAAKAAFWSIVTMVAVDIVKKLISKEKLTTGKEYIDIFVNGAKSALMIAAACACAGIIVGIFSATTLNLRMSTILINLAGGNLILLLIYAAVGAIILGMGLPVLSVYIILAIVIAPAIIEMGVPALAAHMFVFFYGNMAGITPPVGATFFVASGVAKSKVMETGYNAFKLSIAGYLIPFVFAFNQGLFLQGSIIDIIWAVITTLIGIVGMSFGLEGYLFGKLSIPVRACLIVMAALTIIPETYSTVLGLVGICTVVLICWLRTKRTQISATA